MKRHVSDIVSVGVDSAARNVNLEWGNQELGVLVVASLNSQKARELIDALDAAIVLLANTPKIDIKL